MTLKCTQEEYDQLIAPTIYAKEKRLSGKTNKDRAEEIALGTAQQRLDKANDLHEIELEIARNKAKELALRVEARELDNQRKRLLLAKSQPTAQLNDSDGALQPKPITTQDVISTIAVLIGAFVFFKLSFF